MLGGPSRQSEQPSRIDPGAPLYLGEPLNTTCPEFLNQVFASTSCQGHKGNRWVLTGGGWIAGPIHNEEIADVTIRTDDQSAKVVANQIIHMLESN